jgi:hypothetical protein
MLKKKLLTALLALLGFGMYSQVGFNCQFVPGAQFGFVKIKSTNEKLSSSHGAGFPLFMLDRFKTKWYTHLDMNGLYYSVTQFNKSNRSKVDSSKVAKTEGGMFAGRIGYGFGNTEDFRVGPNLNIGYTMSNLGASIKTFDGIANYWNIGGGVFAYKKINGKIRTMAKLGYEKFSNKKATALITNLTGSGMYFEGTVAYNFYQKYGLAVMPAFYTKKFKFTYNGQATQTESKLKSFVLRIGFTKFF